MAQKPVSFEEALKTFDRNAVQQAVQLAENERQEVVKRFPLDAWPTLPLGRYALGQGNKRESFCWWLEFGSAHVGSIKGGIPTQSSWGFYAVAPIPQNLAARILAKEGGKKPVPVDALYRDVAEALTRKGQVILYGPPGTGKTFTARRFSVWWLLKQLGTESPEILSDSDAFAQAEAKLSSAQVVRRVWWVVANPKEWSWDRLFKEKRVTYRYGRLQRNYPLVRRGDLVVGYQSTPDKKLVALARISREMFTNSAGEPTIELEPLTRINDGLTYEELQKDEVLSKSEPMQFRNQGTLFALSEDQFDHLAALLTEREPELRKHLEGGDAVGPLTRLTFHASYSYEDFIEGYRPVDSKSGGLSLKLDDGIFKRVLPGGAGQSQEALPCADR